MIWRVPMVGRPVLAWTESTVATDADRSRTIEAGISGGSGERSRSGGDGQGRADRKLNRLDVLPAAIGVVGLENGDIARLPGKDRPGFAGGDGQVGAGRRDAPGLGRSGR